MKKIQELLARLHSDEKGATIIEYALVAALIVILGLAAFKTLGPAVTNTVKNVGTNLETANGSSIGVS